MENGPRFTSGTDPHRNTSLRFPIVSDSFHRTTEQSFFASRFFFLGKRLFVDKRITFVIATHEVVRRCIAADVAVYAGRVDVVGAGAIFFYALVSIRQARYLRSHHYPQITPIPQIQATVNTQTQTLSKRIYQSE
jgi:hypothetical protein